MGDFPSIFERIAPYTMIGESRLYGLYHAVRTVIENEIPGDIVECGVARGGSAALLALALKGLGSDRVLWVCDTFEGIPAATEDDPPEAQQYTGQLRGDYEDVKRLFRDLGILDNCILVKGLFQDTLPTLKIKEIALLHLDGDWYESTKSGMESLYDKVSPGGIIQIDDYGHWAGCRKAVDEFFHLRSIYPSLIPLDYTGVQFHKEGTI
jgi:macrocin-O-methyltransferase TylF-like protien